MPTKLYVDFGGYSAIEKGNLIIPRDNILNKEDFDSIEIGEVVDIYSKRGKFLGRGFKNPKEVRIMTLRKEELDENYLREKIIKANNYRLKLGFKDTYRMVYTQSDWLNGLVIDKYNDIATVQIFNYGIEKMKDVVVETPLNLGIDSIYEKSSGRNRKRAGLPEVEGILAGEKTETIIKEGDAKFKVTFDGQKTGFFLDQRENRLELERFIKEGDRVLDICCYTGGFSVHAAIKGAEVVGVDLSKKALETAEENMELNNIPEDKYEFIEGNAFEVMKQMIEGKEMFDVVILDQPAFTQTEEDTKNALRAYASLNYLGIRLAKRMLITCSCSHHVDKEMFKKTVISSAFRAKKELIMIDYKGQAPDHPISIANKNLEYLKCIFFYVKG